MTSGNFVHNHAKSRADLLHVVAPSNAQRAAGFWAKPNGGYPESFDTHKDQCNQIKTDTVLMGAAGYGEDFLNPAVGKVLKGGAVLLGVFGITTGCYR
jgi:transcriptional regulator of nitric oxide reductase